MERDGRQYRQLAPRVMSFYVRRRVSFGIAQFCCQCQRIGKLHTFLCHFCQNKIRCAIDNAHNLSDIISGKALLQRSDYGDTPSNCGFKQQVTAMRLCLLQQYMPMHCHQVLIRRYNVLALLQRFADICKRRLNAAHYFYHNINAFVRKNALPVVCQLFRWYSVRVFCLVPYQNLCNFKFRANLVRHFRLLLLNNLIYAAANCTHTQQCDFSDNLLHCNSSIF